METSIFAVVAILLVPQAFGVVRLNNNTSYRNIEFLGRGYDILRSDPRPISQPGIDGGVVSPVFNVSNTTKLMSEGASVIDCLSCMAFFETDIVKSAGDYKATIDSQVDGGMELEGQNVSFRNVASNSYLRTVKEIVNSGRIAVDTATSCIVYCADLRRGGSMLESAFVEAVHQLPNASLINSISDLPAYFNFIERFGTHYISSIKMGSLYWQRMLFSVSDFEKMETEISTAIQSLAAEVMSEKLGQSMATVTTNSDTKKFSEQSTAKIYYLVGSSPVGGNADDWTKASQRFPMPVSIKIIPLSDLLTQEFFPSGRVSEKAQISIKKKNLESIRRHPQLYCKFLASRHANVDCNSHVESSTADLSAPKPTGVFGGAYYKSNYHSYVDNVPNWFTKRWSCPEGYLPLKWATAGLGNPGNLLACFSEKWNYNIKFDPEGAFGGFWSSRNNIKNPVKSSSLSCPSGYSQIRVGQYKFQGSYWTEIFACYRYVAGVSLGGFYLESHSSKYLGSDWINPATGLQSCPSGYTAHLLMSSSHPAFPFNSYYCNRNASKGSTAQTLPQTQA